ncbi:hypothetical protein [Tsukamurella spumae]|uniref:Secreted protein n=1 Tax=Tsukamurella spumae TaxID=44753 RepID=A0A846X567_9ACTN|nr:hypothetical protein [Tsukamurella spumae]NKY19735.1 hypothetical protein [Tsukamurella spumae]
MSKTKRTMAGVLMGAAVLGGAGAVSTLAAPAASATPYGNVEWAQRGPFSSDWTCDQARTQMKRVTVVGASCYGTPSGGYYFSFKRQASR